MWVPVSAEICTNGVLLFRIPESVNEEMPEVGLAHGRCCGTGGLPVSRVWRYTLTELDSDCL